MRILAAPVLLALAVTVPQAAFAHPGTGHGAGGLAHGFLHPLGGLDHVLAMVAIGLVAARMGGRAVWLVPAAFVGMMALGGAVTMAGIQMPFVELGIAASVVALGCALALRLDLPLAGAMTLVGCFAVFHGFAHGAEAPETASGLAFGLGFVGATALLHAAGVGLGTAIQGRGAVADRVAQGAGAAIALAGLALAG